MLNSSNTRVLKKNIVHKVVKGFTLIELMVGVAMLGIIATVALPNLSDFLIRMRVDNEVSEMQRLILTARNTAINMGETTTLCPLASNACTTDWTGQLSVFIDLNDNNQFDAGETLVKVKEAIHQSDNLEYSNNDPVTYEATGLISTTNGNFSYCPDHQAQFNRGVTISASGRASVSSDLDGDEVDEFIGNPPTSIICAI